MASLTARKRALMESLRVKHRQLERYLFYFEKDQAGEFVASQRPRYAVQEMTNLALYQEWTLKDLLAHLIDWERRFLDWSSTRSETVAPAELPEPDLGWEGISPEDFPIPLDLETRPIQSLLVDWMDSYRAILATIESIPTEALFSLGYYPWTGEASLADYAQLCTSSHYDWAKGLIRRWRKSHAGQYLNKGVLLERIRSERRRLEILLERLHPAQMLQPGVIGDWSVKDILAHLQDWEQRFIGWYQAGLRNEVPEIPAPGLGWGQLDQLNQLIFEKHRDRSLADVLAGFKASYDQLLAWIEAMPEEEIFASGRYAWLGEGNLVPYLLANTANHYRWAKGVIRNWLKSQAGIL